MRMRLARRSGRVGLRPNGCAVHYASRWSIRIKSAVSKVPSPPSFPAAVTPTSAAKAISSLRRRAPPPQARAREMLRMLCGHRPG